MICRNCDSTDVQIETIYGEEIDGIEIPTNVKFTCNSCGAEEYVPTTR